MVQPYSSLNEKHGLIRMNRVVQVEPDRPFLLLAANCRKSAARVPKGKVVAELLPHPRAVLESKTTICGVLGIQEKKEENIPIYTPPPKGVTRCESSDQSRDDQPGEQFAGLSASASTNPQRMIELSPSEVEKLALSHVPDRLRETFRRMLKKY